MVFSGKREHELSVHRRLCDRELEFDGHYDVILARELTRGVGKSIVITGVDIGEGSWKTRPCEL